jgi:hypothetical protein
MLARSSFALKRGVICRNRISTIVVTARAGITTEYTLAILLITKSTNVNSRSTATYEIT